MGTITEAESMRRQIREKADELAERICADVADIERERDSLRGDVRRLELEVERLEAEAERLRSDLIAAKSLIRAHQMLGEVAA